MSGEKIYYLAAICMPLVVFCVDNGLSFVKDVCLVNNLEMQKFRIYKSENGNFQEEADIEHFDINIYKKWFESSRIPLKDDFYHDLAASFLSILFAGFFIMIFTFLVIAGEASEGKIGNYIFLALLPLVLTTMGIALVHHRTAETIKLGKIIAIIDWVLIFIMLGLLVPMKYSDVQIIDVVLQMILVSWAPLAVCYVGNSYFGRAFFKPSKQSKTMTVIIISGSLCWVLALFWILNNRTGII